MPFCGGCGARTLSPASAAPAGHEPTSRLRSSIGGAPGAPPSTEYAPGFGPPSAPAGAASGWLAASPCRRGGASSSTANRAGPGRGREPARKASARAESASGTTGEQRTTDAVIAAVAGAMVLLVIAVVVIPKTVGGSGDRKPPSPATDNEPSPAPVPHTSRSGHGRPMSIVRRLTKRRPAAAWQPMTMASMWSRPTETEASSRRMTDKRETDLAGEPRQIRFGPDRGRGADHHFLPVVLQ